MRAMAAAGSNLETCPVTGLDVRQCYSKANICPFASRHKQLKRRSDGLSLPRSITQPYTARLANCKPIREAAKP